MSLKHEKAVSPISQNGFSFNASTSRFRLSTIVHYGLDRTCKKGLLHFTFEEARMIGKEYKTQQEYRYLTEKWANIENC